MPAPARRGTDVVVGVAGIAALIEALRTRGYRVLGPTVRAGVVEYAEIESVDELAVGVGDRQEAGTYRLDTDVDPRGLFGSTAPANSLKSVVSPPDETILTVRTNGGAPTVIADSPTVEPTAVIGVRSCDVHALRVLDRVRIGGDHPDQRYAARRAALVLIGVECRVAGPTCFCASMDTGPRIDDDLGLDLTISEVLDDEQWFWCRAGTELGADLLDGLDGLPATDADREAVDTALAPAAQQQRRIDTHGLPTLLGHTLEHGRWDDVAARCLSCGNCTMVCPTCFCQSVDDATSLDGTEASRIRRWDSCFSLDHSYIHGGPTRPTTRSRYRQWLTHKLGTWHDQFDMSGCVGCGRCITWCPPGIDLTDEVAALQESS